VDDEISPGGEMGVTIELRKKTNSYHDEFAQLEDLCEFGTHRVFQVLRFGLRHLTRREIEDFLTGKQTMSLIAPIAERTCT
jgi:hypothetical protein